MLLIDMVILNDASMDVNLSLVDSNLIFITKNRCDFFKRKAFCVREEDPDNDSSDGTGNDEAEIELPADFSVCW